MSTVKTGAPYLLVRGQDTTITVELHQYGAAVEVTAATATVYDHTGTQVAQYTDVNSREPSVTVLAAVTTGQDFSEEWRVEWDLDGLKVDAAAYVVRQDWTPEVTDADIFARCPALDPAGTACIHSRSDFVGERSEAAAIVRDRMLQAGKRPWMVFDAYALREPLMLLSLALIFEGFGARGAPESLAMADRYRQQFDLAWGRVAFTYDSDQDGDADSATRESATGAVWLCGRA